MSDDIESTLAQRVLTMRIIVIALLNGILVFMGIAVFTRANGQMPAAPDPPMLTYLAFALAVPTALGALLVPRVIDAAAVKRLAKGHATSDAGSLVGVFQQRLIVRSALFEAPAFFSLIAYMIEGQWPTLVIAGLMAFGIATGFPSISRMRAWLEDQTERVAAERASV